MDANSENFKALEDNCWVTILNIALPNSLQGKLQIKMALKNQEVVSWFIILS